MTNSKMTLSKMTLSNCLVPLACALSLVAGCDLNEDELGLDEDSSGEDFRDGLIILGAYRSGKGLNTDDFDDAITKAGNWGYSSDGYIHHAAARMVVADFCGTETPNTEEGTPLGYIQVEPDTNHEELRKVYRGDEMEAAWNRYGAVCVNHARITGDIPCDLPACPPLIDESYASVWSQSWTTKTCGVMRPGVMSLDDVFEPGNELIRGASMTSCNESVTLKYGDDGNLVLSLKNDGAVVWQSNTACGHHVRMNMSGQLEIVDEDGTACWTAGPPIAGAVLNLQNDGNVCTSEQSDDQERWCTNTGWCGHAGARIYSGDMNGDGKDDLICHASDGLWIDYAEDDDGDKADDFSGTDWNVVGGWCIDEGQQFMLGDMDGDGDDDFICHDANHFHVNDGINGPLWDYPGAFCIGETQQLLLGDIDGDGIDDMVCHDSTEIAIDYSSDGFFGAAPLVAGAWCGLEGERFQLTDLDWDGKDDFLCMYGNYAHHDYAYNGFGITDDAGYDLEPRVKFEWSQAGEIGGMFCELVNEPGDPDSWGDNYFCSSHDVGMQWSYDGTIADMDCTQITEENEPEAHGWSNNYLCLPKNSRITFSWSSSGDRGPGDVAWLEDSEPSEHTWNDNWLTVSLK